MLLQKLREYSDRMTMPPALYSEGALRYVIDLDGNGALRGITDTADNSSARAKRGVRRLLPQIQRSSGVKPLLLADKADYVLGYAGDGARSDRVLACHEAFLELLRRCSQATREPSVAAVERFLDGRPLDVVRLPEGFDPSGIITFRVDGEFPIDLPSVQAFWAAENDPETRGATQMQCLVCGHERPVLSRLQGKVKGVPGGQTAGTSLISANAEAFESYGLEASLIAPTCGDCGERFTKALNELLSNPTSRLVLGGAAFLFWTAEPTTGFDPFSLLDNPQPSEVQALLESVRKGSPRLGVDDTRFYATVLSGSGGRAVVRDWLDTTVGDVKEHFATWFERQSIVRPAGEEPQPLSLYRLAMATVRSARDLPVTTPRMLWRGALTGGSLPPDLLFQAIRRNHAEQRITYPRAALIKLVLSSSEGTDLLRYPMHSVEEGYMVNLAEDHPSPAYQCGRLLAVLDRTQRLAIPGVKAGIVDRFFGTASTAPISVFPRLVKGAQPHLSKLERDRPGAYYALQTRIEGIMGALENNFPRTLTLEEQGLFALGYYHQRAHDRAQAREAAERRKAGLAAPEADLADIDELNMKSGEEN